MKKTTRTISLLLVFAMIFTMLTPASVAAAGETLETNATTYEQGEGILVTANSTTPGDWVGLYKKGETPSGSTPSFYWYYVNGTEGSKSWVNGETYNIFATVCSSREGVNDGKGVPAGEYELILMASDYSVKARTAVTITAPEVKESALEVESETITFGEPIRAKATSYNSGAWIGIYAGHLESEAEFSSTTSLEWWYVDGRNNTYMDYGVPSVGEYTVLLTADGNYAVDKVKHVTVEEAKVELLTIDKESYDFKEPVMVTTNYSNPGAWVGVYKAADPTDGSVTSLYWENVTGSSYNIIGRNPQRVGEYVPGEFKVVLFADGGYNAIATVNFAVTTKIDETVEPVRVEPTCEEDGSITYTNTDGTKVVVGADKDESLKATGHAYGDWVYDKESRKHVKTCQNDPAHVESGNCEFDEGKVTTEAVGAEPGIKTFTCKVCEGTYEEKFYNKLEESNEITTKPTCETDGVRTITYNDGTSITQPVPKLGHAYPEDWTYDAETKTHKKVCGNDENHILSGDCEFDGGVINGSEVEYTCAACKGTYKEDVLSTDKAEYKYGDPINVTVKKCNVANSWVGFYKKGETYNPDAGGMPSIFWYYVGEQPETVNILNTRDENGRSPEYKAGEYTVVLFADGGYTPYLTVDITVTTEVDQNVEPVRVEPTCEKDGSITYTNTDGTTFTVGADKDESLKATGHAYGEWVYNAENKTHAQTCANDETHILNGDCEFDEGKVTTEAVGAEAGIRTYTCKICKGTYEEKFYNKLEVSNEITTKPTCETDGVRTITYNDGTSITQPVPKLGHAYPEDWTYDAETKTHKKVCGNDETHVLSDDCNFTSIYDDSAFVKKYTCDVCAGTYENPYIKTDKTEYKYGEPIIVETDYNGDRSWVGLYKKGETYNPQAGGSFSIYWYYIHEAGNKVDITDTSVVRNENGRGAEFVAGEYSIVLFGADDYQRTTSIDITITKEVASVQKNEATCDKDGSIVTIYTDGTKDTQVLPATGHDYPEDWTYVEGQKKHSHDCVNCGEAEVYDCTFGDAVITKEPTAEAAGIKTYTCTVCGGSYTEEFFNKVVKEEKILKEATCEEEGTKQIIYTDGTSVEQAIPATGHAYGEWVFDENAKTHTKTCANDKTHVITEDCTFGDAEKIEGGAKFTCTVCDGSYTTTYLSVDKKSYSIGEPVNVTAVCENDYSWVGIYKKGEKVDPNSAGGVVSLYWYYVVDSAIGVNRSGQTINLLDNIFRNTDRGDGISEGEYTIYLFGDGGYTNVIDTLDITIKNDNKDTEFDVMLNGTSMKHEESVKFKQNTEVKVKVTADGAPGISWLGLYNKKLGTDMDFSTVGVSQYWYYINENNGVEINLSAVTDIGVGDYTLVVYGNNEYDDVRKIVYFTISQDASSSQIIKQPTCTDYGTEYVEYEDGTNAYLPIDPLGHKILDDAWTFIPDDRNHEAVCERCKETIIKECTFDEGTVIEGEIHYTCTVCKGSYTETYNPEEPVNKDVYRISGKTRYETALLTAELLKSKMGIDLFENVVIANGDNFADALAGSYLASVKNAPIILVNKNSMGLINEYITGNVKEGANIYILGGTAAVSKDMESLLGNYKVKRLSGKTRYETNIEILKEAGVKNENLIVCTGNSFADSLSASALKKPILLVDKKLNEVQKKYLSANDGNKFYILGGTAAVTGAVESELRNYRVTERISGKTRYETSVAVAERFYDHAEAVVLAYSMNFPDGLCGGALAAWMNAPMILTASGNEAVAAEYAKDRNIQSGVVLGGSGLISDEAVKTIFDMDANASIIKIN